MAMSINKSWSAFILLFTILLPVCAPIFAQEPPPPMSEEDQEEMLERFRQRMEERQQRGNMPFPGMENMQQRGNRNFQGFPFPQQQEDQTRSVDQAAAPQQMSLESAEGETLRLNFKDVDLSTFVKEIAELLDMTPLVIDSNVQGTVTLYSSEPMSKADVVPLFHIILKQKNAALVEQDGIYQVVPISTGLKAGVDLIEHNPPEGEEDTSREPGSGPPPTGAPGQGMPGQGMPEVPKLSTHVIRVEYVPAQDLIEPIRLLMTEGGVIMPYDRLNMLILTDYSDSIERIMKIINLLDSEYMDEELIDLVKVENNNASDIVSDLEKLFGSGAEGSTTGASFISLDRMNSSFVIANSKRSLTSIKKWINRLDTTTGRNIQSFVYVVKNSTAANIAKLLEAMYSENATSSTGQGVNQQGGTLTGMGGTSNQQSGFNSQQQRGSFGSFSTNTGTSTGFSSGGFSTSGLGNSGTMRNLNGQQLGPQFTTSQGITAIVIPGGEFSGLQDTVRIVIDDVSNRLIIQSTVSDYEFMLATIEKMDVMPRQVIIEAKVYEVDLTDDLSFGVGAALQERSLNSGTVVGVNILPNGDNTEFNGAFTAANVAFVGSSQEILTAIQALREKTNVKVLEAPSLLAMDGTEAHFTVGGEVPYAGSIYYQQNDTAQSVQYRDTGVSLYVRPRITASGSVTMELLQEVSGVGTVSTDLGPTFTKSQVQTTLTVNDGETVAIAGLIRDSNGWTRTGFPLISDIPVIGSLFGTTVRNDKRTELIIMITPHVIKTRDEFEAFSSKFKDSLKNVRKLVDEKTKETDQSLMEAAEDREKELQKQQEAIEQERKEEERDLRRKRN